MRKKENSIAEREVIDRVIHGAQICHLACSFQDHPYVIPISFGYDGKTIYFHTARAGKKNEIFLQNPRVCLAFETGIELIADLESACDWAFDFQSVIAEGEIEEITDPELKNEGLNHIMRHYSGKEWEMPAKEISKTKIWGVKLKSISMKCSPASESD